MYSFECVISECVKCVRYKTGRKEKEMVREREREREIKVRNWGRGSDREGTRKRKKGNACESVPILPRGTANCQ